MVSDIFDSIDRYYPYYPFDIIIKNTCDECLTLYSHTCYTCKEAEYYQAKYVAEQIKTLLNGKIANKYLLLEIIEMGMVDNHISLFNLMKIIDF